jgi:hypothetical protein
MATYSKTEHGEHEGRYYIWYVFIFLSSVTRENISLLWIDKVESNIFHVGPFSQILAKLHTQVFDDEILEKNMYKLGH